MDNLITSLPKFPDQRKNRLAQRVRRLFEKFDTRMSRCKNGPQTDALSSVSLHGFSEGLISILKIYIIKNCHFLDLNSIALKEYLSKLNDLDSADFWLKTKHITIFTSEANCIFEFMWWFFFSRILKSTGNLNIVEDQWMNLFRNSFNNCDLPIIRNHGSFDNTNWPKRIRSVIAAFRKAHN